MNNKDYYSILGLNKNATKEEIEQSYNDLALKYHPDVNKSADAEKKFAEIQEAYDVLSNDSKRRHFDQGGQNSSNFDNSSYYNYNDNEEHDFFSSFIEKFANSGTNQNYYKYNSDFNRFSKASDSSRFTDFFSDFFNNTHNNFFQSRARSPFDSDKEPVDNLFDLYGKREDLGDISLNVPISFKQSILGGSHKIEYYHYNEQGNKEKKILNINLNLGMRIKHGSIVIVKGKGNYSENRADDGKPGYGRLFLQFLVKKEEFLSYDESGNIICNVYVNFFKILFGVKMNIFTIHGFKTLVIPPFTKNKSKIYFYGFGDPHYENNAQINIINIVNDFEFSDHHKMLLKKIYNSLSFSELPKKEKRFLSYLKKKKQNK